MYLITSVPGRWGGERQGLCECHPPPSQVSPSHSAVTVIKFGNIQGAVTVTVTVTVVLFDGLQEAVTVTVTVTATVVLLSCLHVAVTVTVNVTVGSLQGM